MLKVGTALVIGTILMAVAFWGAVIWLIVNVIIPAIKA